MRFRTSLLVCALVGLSLIASAPILAQTKNKPAPKKKTTQAKKPSVPPATGLGPFGVPKNKLMATWPANKAVATVNGQPIMASEINAFLWEWGANSVLQTLMVFKMIDQEAKKQGIVIPEKEILKMMDESFKDLKPLIPAGRTLDQELMSRGTAWSRVYVQIRATQQLDKIIEKGLKKNDLVDAAQIVIRIPGNTEDEQKKNKDATLEQAKKVSADIRAGTITWDEAVAKYSEDPFTKSKGGDLGWRWKEELDAKFAEAVFALKAGEVSEPVDTTMGFLIIKPVKFGTQATPAEYSAAVKRIVEQKRGGIVREMQQKAKLVNNLVPIAPPVTPGGPGGPPAGDGD